MFVTNLWRYAVKSESQEVLFIAKNTAEITLRMRGEVIPSESLSSDSKHRNDVYQCALNGRHTNFNNLDVRKNFLKIDGSKW